ncbi:MAG: CPBP family intramembrane metalloprotease [Ruminococcus sp.]|nr:CPBP family intramembrane metalloprotease [Ruminococcus sp.]
MGVLALQIYQYNFDYQENIKYNYKKELRKDSNKVGLVLLLFFLIMTIASTVTMFIPLLGSFFSDTDNSSMTELAFMEDTTFLMLMSGLVSIITFFGVSIIYSMITRENLGKIFPMDKIGTKLTFHLCTIGMAVCMIANYVSNILLVVLEKLGLKAITDTEYNCDSILDIVLFYVTVAVLPALVEEFAFRGVILGLLRKYSDGLAVLVSGLMFGLMHGNFAQIPFALVVGLMLGFIAVKTNSLLPGIIIHFLNNGLSVTLTLLTTNTNLSDNAVNFIYSIILIFISVLGLLGFSYFSKNHSGFFKLPGANSVINFKEKAKTVFMSPTVIAFTVISLSEAIMMVFLAEVSL